uniref:Calcium-transporting ATPase n=1 Tax=Philodina roseola TaxID=96448 RepID=B2L3L2_PHIRO|nr:plasma membrane calcium-dependent ATPase [Philodina roseola]
MPLFKKNSTTDSAAAGGGDSSMFGLKLEQLKSLMELHGKDLMEKLNTSEFNGVKGVLEKLKVDGNKGLDSSNEQELEQRRSAYGRNEIPPKPMKTFLKLCWDALHDMLLIILLVCAIVSIGLSFYKPPQEEHSEEAEEQINKSFPFPTSLDSFHVRTSIENKQMSMTTIRKLSLLFLLIENLEWVEGVAILVAVLVVVLVTAFNDWRKERQFRGLQNKIEKDQQTSVVRDNKIQQIPVTELVVGDLCFIKYGDLLPADGLLVQASDLKIDESSLTGETDLIKKNENDDVCLLSGTHVMEGSGRMVVTGVGLNSQVGNIMSLLGATEEGSKKKKEEKKKNKTKSKPKKSSTRVSPETSPKTEKKETTVTIENEQKSPSKRSKKLPPLGNATDETKQIDDDDSKKENRPTTSSSVKTKMENGAKKDDDKQEETTKKNEEKSQGVPKKNEGKQDEGEAKPAGLAAMAEETEGNGDEEKAKGGKHKSVLQAKLTQLALYIGYIGMSAAALTFICLVIRFCITNYVIKKKPSGASDVQYFVSFLIQAITVVVVSVPEGLPLAVTLALAYAVRKMMTDNNLVRHLDACETMGNASTICSDKTGTLTTNRMTVVQCYINGKHHEQLPKTEEVNKDLLPLLFESVSVNSNYTSKIEQAKQDEGGLPKQIGNKTECALLDLVQKWGGNYDQIRQDIPEDKLVKVYTFNSARKMMSTIIQRDDGFRLHTKGASEMVLSKCKSIIGENNQPKDLNDEEKKKITHDIIEKMANDGLRTICVCYRDLGKDQQNWDDEEKIIKDLICIGIVGIEDPVRPEVPEAIEKCQRAGVVVRMVTGDNIMTARSIATKCGIIKPNDDFLILEGKEFNKQIRDASGKISQKKLDEVWPKLRVLARSSPQDKYNLVNGIVESQATEHREVVAVTGDGTNDGPALKRADVGFAMGIQGTDVAKQASDIILTDDNFSSIVKAMMWGRNVYDCIAKFLQFQLTANLSAGVISVVCAAAISTIPLRAVQMLWVNLVMDTLASLALATEPPTEELLNRKPYGRTKSIISPLMLRNILGQSLYQLTIMFVILYTGQHFLDVESTVNKLQDDSKARRELSKQFTMVFNAFVLMTLFNEINSRKLHGERNVFKGIWRNPFFYCIWIFCFGAQILIVTFGDQVFGCARLDMKQWGWSLLFGVGSLIWQQILLFVPIEPFSRCFLGIYRICCPCFYRRRLRISDERENSEEFKQKRMSKGDQNNENQRDSREMITPKYMTISLLTNATGVIAPPPTFAKFMLRKSVNRLNSEFNVINQFRSRLEEVKEKKQEEAIENRRNSLAHDAEV